MVSSLSVDKIILFRAGIIVNKEILECVEVENIHCAKIPDFGGLGAIARALKAGVIQQEATLHKVTTKIDEGEVLLTEKYTLNPGATYKNNEDVAYGAGISLLKKVLHSYSCTTQKA